MPWATRLHRTQRLNRIKYDGDDAGDGDDGGRSGIIAPITSASKMSGFDFLAHPRDESF